MTSIKKEKLMFINTNSY